MKPAVHSPPPALYDQVRLVLGNQALEAGGVRVREVPLKSGPDTCSLFRLDYATLSRSAPEFLVLLPVGTTALPTAALRAVEKLKPDSITVVLDRPARLGRVSASGTRVTSLSYDEFYVRLCGNIDEAWHEVLAKTRRDFDLDEYKHRFQARNVRVVSRPDDWDGKGQSGEAIPAAAYLKEWARTMRRRHPIIILGERGSGKTWQMLRFCESQLARNRDKPWEFGPAYYLDLRREAAAMGARRTSVPFFSEAVVREYPSVEYLWGARLATALIASSHTIVCLDGIEEADYLFGGELRSEFTLLERMCAALPLGARFVLPCRATHFGAIEDLLDARAWSDKRVRDTFEVLELVGLDAPSIQAYLTQSRLPAMLDVDGVCPNDVASREDHLHAGMEAALRVCATLPGLLAGMRKRASRAPNMQVPGLDLLEAALLDSVIGYNLEHTKTTDAFSTPDEPDVRLGRSERIELLGDLARHMSLRGIDEFDLEQLPPRIMRYHRLDMPAVRDSIRTHTVFESASDAHPDPISPLTPTTPQRSVRIRFGVRPPPDHRMREYFAAPTFGSPTDAASPSSSLRTSITSVAFGSAPAGVTSVSGAYFLARSIADKMALVRAMPPIPPEPGSLPLVDYLRPIGEVPLGPIAAAVLREMFDRNSDGSSTPSASDLRREALSAFQQSARRRDLSLFSPSLRFLGHNLEALGLVTRKSRLAFDPWLDPGVVDIIRAPSALPDYSMALVPTPHPGAFPRDLATKCPAEKRPAPGPCLLGVREVTNDDFLRFVQHPAGHDWSVERMTIAGGTSGSASSPFASLSNEYHLYFWDEFPGAQPRHQPLPGHRRNPVVYVSWFACAAFCDWLTKAAGQEPHYDVTAAHATASPRGLSSNAYRLPTALEWSWAARGGQLGLKFPWELHPVVAPEAHSDAWDAHTKGGSQSNLKTWFSRWRAVYRETLLGATKLQVPVLSDAFGPCGMSGMMGNVKEWCEDQDSGGAERVILGSTAYLGKDSFRFDYGMTLFPQNTNPDGGFRVCRSLSQAELRVLAKREASVEREAVVP